MAPRRATVLGPIAAALLAAAPARAQTAAEAEARDAFQRGVQAMQQRRYAAAITEFELSYGLVPRCSTQFNLGVALEQTGRHADSLDTFARYERECAAGMPPQNAAYLADALPRLRARMGALALRIVPESEAASVTVDRRPRADWRGELFLEPGAHVVEVRMRDGRVERRSFQVTEGGRIALAIEPGAPAEAPPAVRPLPLSPDPYAEPTPGAAPRAEGLRVDTTVARAVVTVDGREVGEAPVSPRLAPGRHQVEVAADGFRPARVALTLADGGVVTRLTPRLERADTAVEPTSQPFYTRWWFWTIVGVAAAGGAVALAVELSRPSDDVVYTFQAVRLP